MKVAVREKDRSYLIKNLLLVYLLSICMAFQKYFRPCLLKRSSLNVILDSNIRRISISREIESYSQGIIKNNNNYHIQNRCLQYKELYAHYRQYRRFALTAMSNDNGIISEPNVEKIDSNRAIKLGLTGSIGMGKSTVAGHFRDLGIPVFDADAVVHTLYAVDGKAVDPIQKICPDVIVNRSVDRKLLSSKIMNNEISLKDIESIVHPLVAAERNEFYYQKSSDGFLIVVFDVPLLFENFHAYADMDYIVVASASAEVQRQRCLQRPGMTSEKLDVILSKQVPDADKRKRADFVINTDYDGKIVASCLRIHLIVSRKLITFITYILILY